MKRYMILLGMLIVFSACSRVVPTPLPTPEPLPTIIQVTTPIDLPTKTPVALDEPLLLELKKLLKQGLDEQSGDVLANTISFNKWVASLYRQGGTPPIDPRRGLNMSLQFAKENKLVIDLERPTYEPRWSVPVGDTSILVLAIPKEGDPYHAHLYVQREPSAWRYTGILTRIPYYDAPSVAQVLANPSKYDGKEYMYVGAYQPKTSPPANAGTAPEGAAFVLETFSGALWVKMIDAPYVGNPPPDADTRKGENMRVFGFIKLNNGVPYLESDSVEFIQPNSWAHVQGTVEKVDAATRLVTIKPNGSGATTLKLTETSFVSLPDATRGSLENIKAGQTVDATGVPQADGRLLVEELFIAK